MLDIPDDLHADPERPSMQSGGVTVIDYIAESATLSMPVVVTRPTIVFIHEGLKELRSGPDSATLSGPAGHAVVMRSGTHVMSDLLPMSHRYRSTIVAIDRAALESTLGTAASTNGTPPASVAEVGDDLASMAETLRGRLANTADTLERTLAVKNLVVSALLHRPIREAMAADLAGWGPTPHDRVRSIIGRHVYSPLSLPQYASMCAMSVSTFKRRFVEAYGSAPGRWLVDTRLDHAAQLLASESRSVTDVCNDCGFGDLSNFIRAFKKRHGVSPSIYRTQLANT